MGRSLFARPAAGRPAPAAPAARPVPVMDEFDSLAAAVKAAADRGGQGLPGRAAMSRSMSGGQDWDLGAGWEGTLSLVRAGWPEGARKVADLAGRLAARVQDSVRPLATVYGESGGFAVDVSRYLAGERAHFLEFDDMPSRKPVTITVNVGASGMISADQMVARGAVACAAVEILQARGFAVSVVVVDGSHDSFINPGAGTTPLWVMRVRVHAAGDALDRDALAFAAAHPAMARRIGFGLIESHPATFGALQGGYGYPATPAGLDADPCYMRPITARFPTDDEKLCAMVLDLCKAAGAEITA